MIVLTLFVLGLLFPFVGGQCKVDEILVKEDFDPYQYEGKWYLVSMTRLWGIDFSPRNFTNSTGRTSWGDNANKFFGRWSGSQNGSRSWGNWKRRNENGTAPGSTGGQNARGPWGRGSSRGGGWSGMQQGESSTRATSGSPQGSSDGEGWLRKSDGTAIPTGHSRDRPLSPPGGLGGPPPRDGAQQGSWPGDPGGPSPRGGAQQGSWPGGPGGPPPRDGAQQGSWPGGSGGPPPRDGAQQGSWPGGPGGPPPRDGAQQGDWPEKSGNSPPRRTMPPGRRNRNWLRPGSAMSRRFLDVFSPKNFQMETAVRDDSNIDMFIAGEFFGRCIFTKGQGSIANPRNTAKLEVNFPVQWFLPCQPFWIVDTDYVGYSVVYFCLEVLDDGTCEPGSATVWTFNRKSAGHSENEMDKVRTVMKRLCISETDLTAMNQTEYCPIEDENVQNQRNSKPTIHCNNSDQQLLRIALDSPYDNMSSGNNAAPRRSFSPKIFPSPGLTFLALLMCFLMCKSKLVIF